MPYLNIDDSYPDHPKVGALSNQEYRQLMRDICAWSKTGSTDSEPVREMLAIRMVRRAPRHWLPTWLQSPPRRHRGKIPGDVRQLVYERDGFTCRQCGATSSLTLDHLMPWSLGGSDDEDNLQTLCQSCNSRKGARV